MVVIEQIAYNSAAYRAAWQIREATLRAPHGMTLNDEDLSHEAQEHIFAAYDGDTIVGTVMLRGLENKVLQLKQLAVAVDHQGKKIGQALVRHSEEFARSNGFTTILLHARTAVKPFYDKLGYVDISVEHLRSGIPHVTMEKYLSLV